MKWQFDSSSPIYAQIVDKIKYAVVSGEYAPGERILPVRDLAMEAGVNPNTMQRAFAELEREGLIFSQRTSGRFVTEDVEIIERILAETARQTAKKFLDQMELLGFDLNDTLELLKEEQNDGNT